jgi:hypothetical protein
MALGAQALAYRLAIGTGSAAAEIFNMKCRTHPSSLRAL